MDTLLTPQEVAETLQVSEQTLAFWRRRGNDGPVFIRLGRHIRYRASDVEAFIAARTRRSTREGGGR